MATLLLDHGANVNGTNVNGTSGKETPLYIACVHAHVDVMRLCLDRGAVVDRAGIGNWTPLHIACRLTHLEAARLLLERGADHHCLVGAKRSRLGVHQPHDVHLGQRRSSGGAAEAPAGT